MKLRLLHENFDNAVTMAKSIKDKIDSQIKHLPMADDSQKLYLISTAINNAAGAGDDWASLGATDPEHETIINMLAHYYNIDVAKLQSALQDQRGELKSQFAQNAERAAGYGQGDWISDYARQQHIPDTSPSTKKPESRPEPAAAAEKPAWAGVLPDVLVKKLRNMGLDTPQKISALRMVDVLRGGINIGELKQLKALLDKNGLKFKTEGRQRDYRKALNEMLYGQRVNHGSQPFDVFLRMIDDLYIEFDVDNAKFQAAAQKVFKKVPSADEFVELIMNSNQSDGLKDVLSSKLTKSHKASGGSGGACKITMKRGTVMEADHAVIVPTQKGGFVLVGIGPTLKTRTQLKFDKSSHQDFYEHVMVPRGGADPHSTAYRVTRKFSKIMSMLLSNINTIEWANGKTDRF